LRKKNSEIFSAPIFLRRARESKRRAKFASPRNADKYKARESSLHRTTRDRNSFFCAAPRAK